MENGENRERVTGRRLEQSSLAKRTLNATPCMHTSKPIIDNHKPWEISHRR